MKIKLFGEKDQATIDKEKEMLMQEYTELKEQLKELRKQGKDPIIPELIIKTVKAKIEYYQVTKDETTLNAIKDMLKRAKDEALEVKLEKDINIREEINNALRKEPEDKKEV